MYEYYYYVLGVKRYITPTTCTSYVGDNNTHALVVVSGGHSRAQHLRDGGRVFREAAARQKINKRERDERIPTRVHSGWNEKTRYLYVDGKTNLFFLKIFDT